MAFICYHSIFYIYLSLSAIISTVRLKRDMPFLSRCDNFGIGTTTPRHWGDNSFRCYAIQMRSLIQSLLILPLNPSHNSLPSLLGTWYVIHFVSCILRGEKIMDVNWQLCKKKYMVYSVFDIFSNSSSCKSMTNGLLRLRQTCSKNRLRQSAW